MAPPHDARVTEAEKSVQFIHTVIAVINAIVLFSGDHILANDYLDYENNQLSSFLKGDSKIA